MDWGPHSRRGNIALTGEIVLPTTANSPSRLPVVAAYPSTAAKLLQSLAEPFEAHRQGYVAVAARRRESQIRLSDHTSMAADVPAEPCVFWPMKDKNFFKVRSSLP